MLPYTGVVMMLRVNLPLMARQHAHRATHNTRGPCLCCHKQCRDDDPPSTLQRSVALRVSHCAPLPQADEAKAKSPQWKRATLKHWCGRRE